MTNAIRAGAIPIVPVVIIVVALAIAAMVVIALVQHRTRQQRVGLEIANQGNVPSRYELRAESLEGKLAFTFAIKGEPLPQRGGAEALYTDQPGRAGTRSPFEGRSAPKVTPSSSGGPVAAAGRALGFGAAIGDLLYAVGSIAPTSIKTPLLGAASRMRTVEITGFRAMQVPQQLDRVKNAAGVSESGGQNGPSYAESPARPSVASSSVFAGPSWALTPPVAPGETLALDVLARPVGSLPSRQPAFTVFSRPAEQPGAPALAASGTVRFGSSSGLLRVLPYLIVILMAVAILAFVFWSAGYMALRGQ
jgi:hypothetical protein